jgi:hypothetical protein
MEFACPPLIPPFGGQRTSCVGRRRVGGLQIPSLRNITMGVKQLEKLRG